MKNISKLLLILGSLTVATSALAVPATQMNSSSAVAASGNPAYNNTIDDQTLSTNVSSKVNGMYPDNNIEVTAYHGRVLLTGQVKTADLKTRVEQAAQSYAGVRSISSFLSVGENESVRQNAKDTWITTKAKSKLLTVRGVDSNELKVVTTRRKVYVMGNVTRGQATAITNNLKTLDMVKGVVPLFDFTN